MSIGDIKIAGKDYRIILEGSRQIDITDFSPRASTPGGSIVHSELGLYQPHTQDRFDHGFGFHKYSNEAGYLRTVGNIDTRHENIAMLFTQPTSSSVALGRINGFTTWNGRVWAWGEQGLWSYDGNSWQSEYSGAVAVDIGTATRSQGDNVSSLTFAVEIPDTGERCLVVIVHLKSDIAISSVTFNGDAMTSHASLGTTSKVAVYKLVAPDVGTHNVVVTLAGPTDAIATAIPLVNVNQATPLDTAETNTGTGTSSSKVVTSSALNKVIDAITINSAAAGLLVGSGSNLLANPSFETGSITNWTLGAGWTSSSTYAHKGTKSAKLSTASTSYVSITSDAITVVGDTNYLFNMWAKLSQLSPGFTWKMELEWYDVGVSLVRTDVVREEAPAAIFGFKQIAKTFTSPTDAVTCKVVISGKVSSGTSILYVDDGDFELNDVRQFALATSVQDALAGASSYKAGAASVTMAWEWTGSAAFNHLAMDVNPGTSKKVNFALGLGDYLFYCPDNARIRKIDKAGQHTDAGVSVSSSDYKQLMVSGGYVYAIKDDSNVVHYASAPDLSDLHGSTDEDTNEIKIGVGGIPTLSGIQFSSKPLFVKEDGLWELGQDLNARNLLDYSSSRSDANFRGVCVHNGYLLYALRDKVMQWNGVRTNDITPNRLTNIFPYITLGRFNNLLETNDFAFMTARTNETVYTETLLCYDGVGWFRLGDPITDGDGSITAMGYDTVNNRLWYHVSKAASETTYYVQFQNLSDFPYANFPTTGTHSLITSEYDMGFRRVLKSMPSILVQGSNLDAGTYLNVYYSLDGGAWVLWGTINESGVTELTAPGGNRTVEFNYANIRVDFKTDTATESPVLESLTIRFIMRPKVEFAFTNQVVVATRAAMGGGQDNRTAAAIVAALETLRDSPVPFEYVDILGRKHFVYISSVQVQAIEKHLQSYDQYKNVEQVANVNFVAVKV
jgi:hypothetical protein